MGKNKNTSLLLTAGALLIALCILGWLIFDVFEGENPHISLQPLPEYLAKPQEFNLYISDMKRGLKDLHITIEQEGRQINLLSRSFPFQGLFNREGTHAHDGQFMIDPSKLNLAQGRIDLNVSVRDHSRRGGGDGNATLFQHKMIVDTIPPSIRAMTRQHYVNKGGTGLVIYQTSSDSVKSGVYVGDTFFTGFPAPRRAEEGYHVCYFSVGTEYKTNPEIYLWAEDKAGNLSQTTFYYHIRRKNFRTEKFNISDGFLKKVLPYFSFYDFQPDADPIEKYIKINQDLRMENAREYYEMRSRTSPKQLWSGKWLRLQNAANMARFGDRRKYFYNGKKIDEQIHNGVDLASLANSEVPAANSGMVVYAGRIGIYGETVVVDHGQGLSTIYAHLSQIRVSPGNEVTKGQVVGLTGQTGLAAGDHLHFSVMVNGVFVNPIEWWDYHWIEDNVLKKLALLE